MAVPSTQRSCWEDRPHASTTPHRDPRRPRGRSRTGRRRHRPGTPRRRRPAVRRRRTRRRRGHVPSVARAPAVPDAVLHRQRVRGAPTSTRSTRAPHPPTAWGPTTPPGRVRRYLRGVVAAFHLPTLLDTEVQRIEPDDDGFRVTTSRGPVSPATWSGPAASSPTRSCPVARAPRSGCTPPPRQPGWHVRTRGGRGWLRVRHRPGVPPRRTGATVTVVDPSHPWAPAAGPTRRSASPRGPVNGSQRADQRTPHLVDDGQSPASNGPERVHRRRRRTDRLGRGRATDPRHRVRPGLGPAASLFDTRATAGRCSPRTTSRPPRPGCSWQARRSGTVGCQFCFVYKFRQRFAHVARVIGERAGRDCVPCRSGTTPGCSPTT